MTQGTLEPFIATRIALLIDALGTATKVAECMNVPRPLLSKWRDGSAREWLFGYDSYLEGAHPIDVLHLRGVNAVLDALDAGEQLAWGG